MMNNVKRAGAVLWPADLSLGDRVAMGVNGDPAKVVDTHVMPHGEVLLVLAVPARTLIRLQR